MHVVGGGDSDMTWEQYSKVRQEALAEEKVLLYPEEIWRDVEEEDPSMRKLISYL